MRTRRMDSAPVGANPVVIAPHTQSADGLRLPKKPGSLRFAVMGDMGRGDATQYDTAAQMATWRAKFDFSFVLMLGDNLYSNGSGAAEEYALRFERPYRSLLDAGVVFYATLGNHDPPDEWNYAPFHMDGHRYYSFTKTEGPLPVDQRTVEFFAVDSVAVTTTELSWLRSALETSKADWRIAFYHHPLYSSGRYWLDARRRRITLEPVFMQGGLDVGLNGHEHIYERIVPQNGVQYFTSGAGGALRKGDLRRSSLTAAGFDQDTHFMLMEISGDTLYFQTISRTGDTVDSGQFDRVKHHAPLPVLRK